MSEFKKKFCVAPMMNWTDRHCRSFMRLISKNTILYTEMITTGALLHGDADYHLKMSAEESPVSLQLGGSSPQELEKCAKLVERYNYSEINFISLEKLLEQSFSSRRKKIKNTLRNHKQLLTKLDIDENLRPENLSVSNYCDLVKLIN